METEGLPYAIVRSGAESEFVLTCEHASNAFPNQYGSLGMGDQQLQSHIAWDIGAAGTARALSEELDAPLILGRYSRLLIDLNRPLDRPSSIVLQSDGYTIPGNQNLSESERRHRQRAYFDPFQAAVSAQIYRAMARQVSPILVAVHSFEPELDGQRRPWEVGIVYGKSVPLAKHLITWFDREERREVGDNQPYRIDEDDYTIPVHGESRSLCAVLIEIRNDLLRSQEDMTEWARALARSLRSFKGPT